MEPVGSDIEGLSVYYCDLAGGATECGDLVYWLRGLA